MVAALLDRFLKFLDKKGQRHKALKAFEWMDKNQGSFGTQDPFLYSQLMEMFSRKSAECSIALQLFDSMPERGVKPDLVVFNAAINAAGEHKVGHQEELCDACISAVCAIPMCLHHVQ